MHITEVDGGDNVEPDAVEEDGGVEGDGFCEVSVRTARNGVGAGECWEGYEGGL